MTRHWPEPLDRFNARVAKSEACWIWTGHRNKQGYGQFWLRGRNVAAHRASWEFVNGAIPDGEGFHGTCVCHRCDNPSCVRPDHLFLGTMRDNIHDMIAKDRKVVHNRTITSCKRGHPFTTENTYIEVGGGRRCRACARQRTGYPRALRTHCHKGHEFVPANVRMEGGRRRRCAACRKEYSRAYSRTRRT